MTDVATLWVIGIACLIVALVGKSITIGTVQLPETAGKKVRVGMVAVGVLALVLGAVLFVRPNGYQQSPQTSASNGAVATASSPASSPESSTGASQPVSPAPVSAASHGGTGTPSATTQTSPPTPPQASPTQQPLYLDTLTPITDGAPAPQAASWQLGTRSYSHSLEYTVDSDPGANPCSLSATYSIPGSYQYLVATVGVPNTASSQGGTVNFEVDDDFGDPLGNQSAQYGQPAQMHVPVQGLSTLTLLTSSPQSCAPGASWQAVWADAELLP